MSAFPRLTLHDSVADVVESRGYTDPHSPEIDAITSGMLERQRKISAGIKRRNRLQSYGIISGLSFAAGMMLMAASGPSVADQVTKGMKDAGITAPVTVPAASTSAASPKP